MTTSKHLNKTKEKRQPLVGREQSFYKQFNSLTNDAINEKREFDKKFFYIVASFFVFSILLIQFMKNPHHVNLLLITWYSNLCALIFHVFAHLAAAESHLERRKMYANMDENDNDEKEKVLSYIIGTNQSPWTKVTTIMEMVSYVGFLSAVIFLLWFTYLNLI